MASLVGLTVNDTGFLQLPVGTTAQRVAAAVGDARYNTNTFQTEWYNGIEWMSLIPPGAVRLFARSSAPAGWIKANGAGLSTTTYNALFQAIGYTFGGSGATFNVPDMRGTFLRGWDDGRTVDNGRGFGTYQDQDWKGFYQSNTGSNTFSYSHGPVYMGKTIFPSHTGNLFGGFWSAPAASWGTAWDTSEVRPRNVALLACIKF
jgi:hypothetical protein